MKRVVVSVFVVLLVATSASAQTFAAQVQFAASQWSEFDGNDLGFGGTFTWQPLAILGVDANLTVYPGDFPPDSAVPFSGNRFEGLFGATIGPRLGRVRPFAKAGAGFLQVGETPMAFACVAIFPPPLACTLAGGATMPIYEIGGGVEINASSRTFVRVDIADRILKYPGPTFRGGLSEVELDGFFGHAVRFTLGGGVRF